MKKILLVFGLLPMLSSCGLYRSYQRPHLDGVDSLYSPSKPSAHDTISLASLSWRELFSDVHLQHLIEQGLESNTDLRVARIKVEEAKLQLLKSKLSFLPSLDLRPQGSLSKVEGSAMQQSFALVGDASWELDLFGKKTNAKRRNLVEVERTEAYRQAVQTKLVATIAGSYYALLMLDSQLDIAEQTRFNWMQTVKTLELLKQVGGANDVAVLQTKASLLDLEGTLLEMQKDRAELENALSVLLAGPFQPIERGTLEEQHFPDTVSLGLPIGLLSNRPDVRGAEMELAQAFYDTNSARAAFYPGVTLAGNGGWTNSAGEMVVNPARWLFNAVGSLVQPLFNQGKNVVNLKVSKLRQEEATLNFQQTLLVAGQEVNDALSAWQNARKQLDISRQKIEHLSEAVDKTQLLMKHSSVNYLEVLTAQQSLLSAEMMKTKQSYEQIKCVIDLYQALGGGY